MVEESGTLLARGFYTAGSKMTSRTQVGSMFLGQGSMPSPPFPVTTVLPKKKEHNDTSGLMNFSQHQSSWQQRS